MNKVLNNSEHFASFSTMDGSFKCNNNNQFNNNNEAQCLKEQFVIDQFNKKVNTSQDISIQNLNVLNMRYIDIGSNNYFVYACPKRLAYDENGRRLVHFTMPDINDPDVIEYGHDDHTTPVYTNGEFDDQNLLVKLDECKMEFMEEFEYTNPSGYTETYVIWKTNGFFTRKYDDYEFKMSIKSEEDFVGEIDTEFTDNTDSVESTSTINESSSTDSIRIVNTASPTGADVNDNVVFINTLNL